MSTFDTVIVHDIFLNRPYVGSTRAEVLDQFATLLVEERPDGGRRVHLVIPGFSVPIELSYSSQFTLEETLKEAARDALGRLARNYASRYRVYFAEAQ
jgi:hypothetical protein